jgi:hypothetical protein
MEANHYPVVNNEVPDWDDSAVSRQLAATLNKFGVDTATDTPDLIFGDYLVAALRNYAETASRSATWMSAVADQDR